MVSQYIVIHVDITKSKKMQNAKAATSQLAQSDLLPAPSEATFGEAKRRTVKEKSLWYEVIRTLSLPILKFMAELHTGRAGPTESSSLGVLRER